MFTAPSCVYPWTHTVQTSFFQASTVITKIKILLDGLHRVKTEDRICELEDRLTELTWSEQQRENGGGAGRRVISKACGTIRKPLES